MSALIIGSTILSPAGNLRRRHSITCFHSFSLVRRGPEPCWDRSFAKRQGFRAVDYPFRRSADGVSCEIACLTWANIFLRRFNFESAVTPVLYEPHKIAMSMAFATATPCFGGISATGQHYSAFRKGQGESPRIQTLSRSSSRQAFIDRGACLRRTARRPDCGFDVFASSCAWDFRQFALKAFRAAWRPRCRSIVHISLGYMTEPLAWFNWIVLMMSPPSNPPGGSSTGTTWSFGKRIGL